ncbi:MAG: motility protein A [Firmicutes bacterium HGW-Firmicutes-13]|nr:MAG: motility protein A [Firmicutes bacterium HGW-Firmicutes-13]
MDMMTVLGIVLGVGLVSGAIVIQGNYLIFWNPAAVLITMGGSFAALLINFHLGQVKSVFQVTKQVFLEKKRNPREIISFFYNLAQKARREGLLALEDDIHELEDPFLKKGLQMMVDGMEPEIIKDILNTEVEALSERHNLGQEVFRSWGALAPAFGMIGTLIGLIQMLVSLDDPSAIGPGMAVALLTTFYGALFANLILIPMAGKLAIRTGEEILIKGIMMDGIFAIQSGVNPRVIEDKLKAFLAPGEREEKAKEPEEEYEEGVITDNV